MDVLAEPYLYNSNKNLILSKLYINITIDIIGAYYRGRVGLINLSTMRR